MKHRADILVVLGHVLLVRNYVADGFLRELVTRGLKVAVIAPDDTHPFIRQLAPGLVALYPLSRYRPRRPRMWVLRHLRLGSFFARRTASAYALKLAFNRRLALDKRLAIGFWERMARVTDPEKLAKKWASALRPRRAALRLIREVSPRIVVWPTTISDPVDFEVVQAARLLRVPVVMCEGSWDNLVCKGAIWPRPGRLLVWGELSRNFARDEHGFTDAEIGVTGPPHFGVYNRVEDLMPRDEWLRRHDLDPARRVIFVAGTTIGRLVEPTLVHVISSLIDSGDLPPSYVWYRPHPKVGDRFEGARCRDDPNVRIDPGVDNAHPTTGMNRIIDARETRQRAEAIAACDLVVSMFSTVVLEGALLGKPSILVDPESLEGSSSRPASSSQNYKHVQYLLRSPWIRLAPNLDALQPMLHEFLSLDPRSYAQPLRAFAQQVVCCGIESSQDRIVRDVQDCLVRLTTEAAH